jgi:hypothetical protein
MRLNQVRDLLHVMIRELGGSSGRRWWDVMREEE